MNIITAYSNKMRIEEAAEEIQNKFKGFDTKLVVFFASSVFDPGELSQKMQEVLGTCPVFGCTTAGEIVSGKMLKNSVVAMAFNSEVIDDVKIEIIEDVHEENNVRKTFESFEEYYNIPMADMDINKFVGIILIDGLSGAEENVMDKIGDLTNVIFVGGAAGDDLKFSSTHVFVNGQAFTNAAVLALLKPKSDFEIIKTQSFCVLDKKLVATKANEAKREVLEFNNKPAYLAYSEAINKPVEDAHNFFMHNPVGLIIDGEPYVRSPQQIKGNKMIFYCNVVEGMEVSLLESTDIVEDTEMAIQDTKKKMDKISGIINFHCILRTLELEQKRQEEAYANIFKEIPTIGFSTYGEEYMGHINQTSTMIAFK